MSRRFSLSSDQLELLLAFEENKGLAKLAEAIGRDQSVISRGLQRIAEDFPVLVKIKGRWEMTPLGRQVNEQTRSFVDSLTNLIPSDYKKQNNHIHLSEKSVLVIINAQVGLLDATQEGRNNSKAEENIELLLSHWRKARRPVAHIKHISDSPGSVFFRKSSGSEILPSISPGQGEGIFEKTKASAFADTSLLDWLSGIEVESLFFVGFTANECIDASAKDAAALGLTSYVVGDATAVFDMRGYDGKLIKAERLHKLTLANINAYSSRVIQTSDVVDRRP